MTHKGYLRPLPRAHFLSYFLWTESMTTSRRLADRKIAKFQKNITKRGSVPEKTAKKGDNFPVGPILLGFFIFVVVGSCIFVPDNKNSHEWRDGMIAKRMTKALLKYEVEDSHHIDESPVSNRTMI
ncbi:Ribosome associated membrane protein RAMP4 [Musa troglodytarum]|uniref:Ribosome associated membrane protein RAMP4 n=1 Tax=Musa troglodytarum TaxID=320322 RepID=A0A9E7FQL9_9LILI|nr:Ribosome associated membrane protein RAMP4 [Musa troglodytarum]